MKIINESVVRAIHATLVSAKKVSRVTVEVKDLQLYFNTIEAINALNEDISIFQGTPLTEWKIAPHFKEFILPEKVSVSGNRHECDLLVKPTVDPNMPVLTANQFTDMTLVLMGAMKTDLNNIVSVASLRMHVMLATCAHRAINSKGDAVYYAGQYFFPLEFNFSPVKDLYCQMPLEDMVTSLFLARIVAL